MSKHFEQKNSHSAATSKKEHPSDDVGACTLCGIRSVCKCERCGDFYCSPLCQSKDWPNHRYICFPMPRLVEASLWPLPKDNIMEENIIPLQNESSSKKVFVEDKPRDVNQTHPEDATKPTNGSCVILTGFRSTNRCYIRSTNPSVKQNYKKVLKEIDDFGKTAPVLSERPEVNTYALAPKDKKWCRVKILGYCADGRARVFFTDYGNTSKLSPSDLRQITPNLISLECYIHMAQLKDIMHYSVDEKYLKALSKFTNQEFKVEFVKPDKMGGNVQLFNWGNKSLLNTSILTICSQLKNENKDNEVDVSSVSIFSSKTQEKDLEIPTSNGLENKNNDVANNENGNKNTTIDSKNINKLQKKKAVTPPRQIQVQKPCLEPPFKIIPLDESDRGCNIIIADGSFSRNGYIGCLLEKHCENLKEVTNFLKEYNISEQPYKPKCNEYCLANFENEWYRAKVVEIIGEDKYLVVYIDFTNEAELTSNSIRHYPMSLTRPCHTTLCAIDGLPEDLSDEISNFLELECSAFTKLHVDNVRIIDNIKYVESKALMKKLRDNKLL